MVGRGQNKKGNKNTENRVPRLLPPRAAGALRGASAGPGSPAFLSPPGAHAAAAALSYAVVQQRCDENALGTGLRRPAGPQMASRLADFHPHSAGACMLPRAMAEFRLRRLTGRSPSCR